MHADNAMRRETVDEHIVDLVWPPESRAQWMRRGGLAGMGIGVIILALGFVPGMVLPRVLTVDPAFIASAGVIGGLLSWSYGSARAVARRLRIDRRARTVERAKQTAKGSWNSDVTLSFDECATLAIVEDDVDDRATSYELVAQRTDGDKVRPWPVPLRTRADAEAALALLRDAITPRTLAE